jgi:hypothetical protein
MIGNLGVTKRVKQGLNNKKSSCRKLFGKELQLSSPGMAIAQHVLAITGLIHLHFDAA